MNKIFLNAIVSLLFIGGKCISYVCETFFVGKDTDNPNYSSEEFDFYVKIAKNPEMRNHRLTLYKNMKTGNFEVYRQFMQEHKTTVQIDGKIADITNQIDTELKETAKIGNLEEYLIFVNNEREKYHKLTTRYCMCTHQSSSRALHCSVIPDEFKSNSHS